LPVSVLGEARVGVKCENRGRRTAVLFQRRRREITLLRQL
jgi:translation initiation factor IF-1